MENVNLNTTLGDLKHILLQSPKRLGLIHHPVLKTFQSKPLSKSQVAVLLGQWYHPLYNFPYFLSSCIAHSRELPVQTFISDILYQELGSGNVGDSHLGLYFSTMEDAGFTKEQVGESPAFTSTEKLLAGYRKAAKDPDLALGFLYATEVADLAMVSSIGISVKKSTGKAELPWVDIHVEQEPHHVDSVNQTLEIPLTPERENRIKAAADEMWELWIDFFEEIGENIQL